MAASPIRRLLLTMSITMMRVDVMLLPTFYLFSHHLDVSRVWWAFILAEGVSTVVGAFLLKRIYSQKVAPLEQEQGVLPLADAA